MELGFNISEYPDLMNEYYALGNLTNNDVIGGDFHDSSVLSEFDQYLRLGPLNVVLIVLYGIVFIIGLLGNILVILVIIRFKRMRTVTNLFLVNLTMGDVLVILICIPLTLGNQIYTKWIYGEVLCKLAPFIQGSAVSVSVLSLLSISISRYFAIYKPLTAKIMFSKRNVRIMLLVIWIISFASFSPLLVVNTVASFGLPGLFEIKLCQEDWPRVKDKNVYNIFIFCILFVWPFIIMAVAYTVIGQTLWVGNAMLYSETSSIKNSGKKNNLILRQRRRTVKMLVCVICVFAVCWLPYYIVNIWMDLNGRKPENAALWETVGTYVYPIVLLLGLGNSAVNPVLYCFLSNGFRRAFVKLFMCKFLFRRSSSFVRTSFRFKSTLSDSVETADV